MGAVAGDGEDWRGEGEQRSSVCYVASLVVQMLSQTSAS